MTSNSDDVLQQLSDAGVSIWLDDISRERLTTGNLATLIRDMHVVGVTSNPTIFAHALSSGSAYDDQIADLALRGVSVGEASRAITTFDIRWACDVFRPVYEATGGTGRPGLARGGPAAGRRHAQDDRRGQGAVVAGGPAEHVHQDPGHPGGTARDHRVPGRGNQHQRHADLLAGPVRRGDRRVHGRARAGRGGRPRPVVDLLGGLVLREPGGHGGGQPAGQAGHARGQPRCGARPRSPTPGWPTSCTSSGSPRRAGRRCGPPAPTRSGRCGPRRAPRIPNSTTRCTWSTWSPRAS